MRKKTTNRVFQIAYDESLLFTRSEMLRHAGYDVTSVLGNSAAKTALTSGQEYSLFIVGRDAPVETREEMIRWLKENFPTVQVLALNAPHEILPVADYNVVNEPGEWLVAVRTIAF
jgi:DNA-binding response OmpR family regulator